VENRRVGKVSRNPAIRLGKRGVGVALVELSVFTTPVLTMNVPLVLVLTLPAASASKRYKPVTAWARSLFHCHWNSCDDC
jgi:hypothetical protein